MNKERKKELKKQYIESQRIPYTGPPITLLDLFKETYRDKMTSFPIEQDGKKYKLIERYEDKVSDKLIKEYKELKKKGQEQFFEDIKTFNEKMNKIIPSKKSLYHMPVILGLEYGISFDKEEK